MSENRERKAVATPEGLVTIDVNDILMAFEVTCPFLQYAIKQLLAPGSQEGETYLGSLEEAKHAIGMAIDNANVASPECPRDASDGN